MTMTVLPDQYRISHKLHVGGSPVAEYFDTVEAMWFRLGQIKARLEDTLHCTIAVSDVPDSVSWSDNTVVTLYEADGDSIWDMWAAVVPVYEVRS